MLNRSQYQRGLQTPAAHMCPVLVLLWYHGAAGWLGPLIWRRTNPSPTMAEPSMVRVGAGSMGSPGRWQGHTARLWHGERSPSANSILPIQLIKHCPKMLCQTKPSQQFFFHTVTTWIFKVVTTGTDFIQKSPCRPLLQSMGRSQLFEQKLARISRLGKTMVFSSTLFLEIAESFWLKFPPSPPLAP